MGEAGGSGKRPAASAAAGESVAAADGLRDVVFDEAADHLIQGITIFDADLRLRFCNRRAIEVLGLDDRLRTPGTPFEDFIRFNALRGEYGPGDVEEQVADRVALARRFEPHEMMRQRPDGRILRIVGRPLPSGGFVTTYTDVTEEVRSARELEAMNRHLDELVAKRTRELALANQALSERSAFLQSVVDHLPVGITVFDGDLRLEVSNRLFQENTGVPEWLCVPGTHFAEFMRYNARRGEYGPGDVEEIVAEKVELAKKMAPHQFVRQRQDGRFIEVRGEPLVGGGFITTYTDVTDREAGAEAMRQAKEEAERASRAKSEFLANMSHELRTPLNAIIGFTEMIIAAAFGPHSDPRYAEYAEHVHASGHHLLGLINDILDISAIEAGTVRLHEETVVLPEVAESALLLVKGRASRGGVKIERRIPKNLPALRGDRRRILQVITNLLSNAVKFTPQGGRAILSLRRHDNGDMEIVVEDNGTGIPPEKIPQVMEPFGQVETSQARRNEGTGLGLPLSRNLVEMHGGTLTLESVIGKGTRVSAVFPGERVIR